MKTSFAEILEREERERKKKVSAKLPHWAECDELTFPSSLSLEQSSSQMTAEYKAVLAASMFNDPENRVVWDLTGGLGVDSWAFSKKFSRVIYNEHNSELAAAARKNFSALEANNIDIFCTEAEDLSLPGRPDMIYLDPARRNDSGKKVFLVEDCKPDVLSMLPSMFGLASTVMVKLSPMADITMLAKRFSGHMKAVHILGISGECKEVLCILDRGQFSEYEIVVSELDDSSKFCCKSSDKGEIRLANPQTGDWLWEPCAALMKAGCFSLLSLRYKLPALDLSTHLYVSDRPSDESLFKSFQIVDMIDFSKAGFKEVSKKYPNAEVSARNVPVKSDELRRRLAVKPGGDFHIFACLTPSGRKLLITKCSHHSDK